MKLLVLALSIFLGIYSPAVAVQWIEAATETNGSIAYVDLDSFYKDSSNVVIYWEKVVHKNIKNIPGETMVFKGKRVWYIVSLKGEDCGVRETVGPYQATFYGMEGLPLYTYKPVDSFFVSRNKPIPDSFGANIHDLVCALWIAKQAVQESPPAE